MVQIIYRINVSIPEDLLIDLNKNVGRIAPTKSEIIRLALRQLLEDRNEHS